MDAVQELLIVLPKAFARTTDLDKEAPLAVRRGPSYCHYKCYKVSFVRETQVRFETGAKYNLEKGALLKLIEGGAFHQCAAKKKNTKNCV